VLETFTSRGLIGSLIFNNTGSAITPDNFQHITNTTPSTTGKNPFILVGNWGLNVMNKKITYFEVNFAMVRADGTDRHTHEFTNFKRTSVLLDPRGTSVLLS
jgi:hypothetical protein